MSSPINSFSDCEVNEGYDDYSHYYYDQDISDGEFIGRSSDSDDEEQRDRLPGMKAFGYDPSQLTNHPSGMPLNGHDHLKLVQEERERLPAVVSAPPPAPQKSRTETNTNHIEENLSSEENLFFDENTFKDEIHMKKVKECCSPRDQSIAASSSNSSEQLFSPIKYNEESPKKQLGIEPLAANSNSFILNTSLDNSLIQADISMATSEFGGAHNKSNCSIMSSSVFREKIKLKSSLLNSGQLSTVVGDNQQQQPKHQQGSKFHQTSSKNLENVNYCAQLLKGFKELRSNIINHRAKLKQTKSNSDNQSSLFLSEEELVKQQNRDKKLAETLMNRAIGQMNIGLAPPCNELVNMTQKAIHLTLEQLADRCERTPNYSTLHADWIYSLMACLHEPIEADICSSLRRLAKFCMTRRDIHEKRLANEAAAAAAAVAATKSDMVVDMECDLLGPSESKQTAAAATTTGGISKGSSSSSEIKESVDKEEYLACILIICIVRHIFGQTDLK